MLTTANAKVEFESAARLPDRVSHGTGRGIVICGGGLRYFACAWVCINRLRDLGCRLPIELWYLGHSEMDQEMQSLVTPLAVRCVDGLEVRQNHPSRILNGWELKPYAILHCNFREVLLLDADNVSVVDPAFLFETPQYVKHGAIFWPDYGRLGPQRSVWQLTGVPYRDEPEFETGQIVVDRLRCQRPLTLTMWMNEHSDFWYTHIHGDKETFHLAWRKLGMGYAMPNYPIEPLPHTMCQHEFGGRRIFQHRNGRKWSLDAANTRVPGFIGENECLRHLADLRNRWRGRPTRPFEYQEADEATREAAQWLCTGRWLYSRGLGDRRPMSFVLSGEVREGAREHEVSWNLNRSEREAQLTLIGIEGITCQMKQFGPTRWNGHWRIGDRAPVELTRLAM